MSSACLLYTSFAIQRTEEGYDYSFYDEDFRLMDGGVYENDQISIEEAAEELLEDEGWTGERIRGDYDQLMEKVEEMDEVVMAEIQNSQGEYKPLAKVEELEEVNYNMIDNVLNNMPPKKEPYLEYFAAECDELDVYKRQLCTVSGSNSRGIHGNLEPEDVPMD